MEEERHEEDGRTKVFKFSFGPFTNFVFLVLIPLIVRFIIHFAKSASSTTSTIVASPYVSQI